MPALIGGGPRAPVAGGVELLEGLTSCQAIDKVPEILILGVEPFDIKTVDLEPTPAIHEKADLVINMVLKELDRLGVSYKKGEPDYVPCNSG